MVSGTIASQQEQSLEEVYDSAFLSTATGDHLDRVVEIVGISRDPAKAATGTVTFESTNPVTQDHVIQSGTEVQTDSDDPVVFSTTEPVTLEYIEGFETDLSNYVGDTGNYSRVNTPVADGSNALECDATSGAQIRDTSITVEHGTVLHGSVHLDANTVSRTLFAVQDSNNYYQIAVDANGGRFALEKVDAGSTSTVVEDTSVSVPTSEYLEFVVDWRVGGDFHIELFDANDNSISDPSSSNDTEYTDGGLGFESGDATGTKRWDKLTTSAVTANIEAEETGPDGNVGAQTIIVAPAIPSGVDSLFNRHPTGDDSYSDTNGDTYTIGADEESDDELRNRTRENLTASGVATADALTSNITNNVDGVQSVTIFENKTNTDNTGSGGLPEYSFELVVFGGDSTDIAEAIFDRKAVTSRDYAGAHGSSVSETVEASNGQSFTIDFSRPNEVNTNPVIDLVVTDEYAGDSTVEDDIVAYVGGVNNDNEDVIGTGVGEDVYIDQLEEVINSVTGVRGIVSLDVEDEGGSSIVTTDSDGLDVVSVASSEVATTDATDGSITITTTDV